MIRSTKNESISTAAKKRHGNGPLDYTGTKGQSYELARDNLGANLEVRDEFDSHVTTTSDFPSNAFNGLHE